MMVIKIGRGSMASDGMFILVIRVTNMLLTLLVSIFLARVLGPEEFGYYSYIFAIVSIASIPANGGTPPLVIREIARNFSKDSWSEISGVLIWSFSFTFILSLFCSAGVLLYLVQFNPVVESSSTVPVGLIMLCVPLISLSMLCSSALRGLYKFKAGTLPEQILAPVVVIVFVFTLSQVLHVDISAANALIGYFISIVIAFVVSFYYLLRYISNVMLRSFKPLYRSKEWVKSVLPLGAISGLNVLYRFVGLLILGLTAPLEDVGVFRVAFQLSILLSFGTSVISTLVSPHIARIHSEKKPIMLQKILKISANLSFMVAVIGFLILFFQGEWVISVLFGSEYGEALLPIIILATGQLINSATGLAGVTLNMSGLERCTFISSAIGLVLNIGLCLILIPIYGSAGAAVGASASIVIMNVLLWYQVKDKLGIDTKINLSTFRL